MNKDGRKRRRCTGTKPVTTTKSTTTTRPTSTRPATKQHLHINWSNFKQEFSGKTDEDAEVYLLCSNDWMNAHHFDNDVKVLHYTIRRGKIMVSLFRTHKCRLARTEEFI